MSPGQLLCFLSLYCKAVICKVTVLVETMSYNGRLSYALRCGQCVNDNMCSRRV